MQIIVKKMTSTPHWLPPLSLLAPCWRHRHRCHGCHGCHGCRVAVAIAAAAATSAAFSAATVSAAIATAFWLIAVCPCAASLLPPLLPAPAIAAVGCRRHHHCRCNRKPLPPAPSAAAAASASTAVLLVLGPSNILNIFTATFRLIVVYPRAVSAFATVACPAVAQLPTSSSQLQHEPPAPQAACP